MTNVVRVDAPRAVVWSARLVEAFGVLMTLNWVVAAVVGGAGATRADLMFAAALLGATIWCGARLRARGRSGWIGAIVIAFGGLFFVAPVVGTIVLGGGASPVGTGWDVVFFPLSALVLLALLVVLHRARSDMGTVSETPR
jgi:hypothetical protein